MKKLTFFVICFLFSIVVFAQPGGGGDPGGGEPVPLAGIELLLSLGAILGVKKIYSLRNTHKNS